MDYQLLVEDATSFTSCGEDGFASHHSHLLLMTSKTNTQALHYFI